MRAVVFCLHADGESVTFEPFDGPDCLSRAHQFRQSIEEDFPGALMAVTGDEEAAEDRADRLFARLGFERPTR